MIFQKVPIDISPAEFERTVKGILDAAAGSLVNYESAHLETLSAPDGEYAIDVTARFSTLGADFCVIVECKRHKRKVERQDVQVLYAKLQSLGAQKAMLFSTAGFQSGAIKYADAHGVALVQLSSGTTTWFTKGAGETVAPPLWVHLPKYVGWWCRGNSRAILSDESLTYTRQTLGFSRDEP